MGIEALTTKDDGTQVQIPKSSGDWQSWISAGRTRNWLLEDPLIDWLQEYGDERDYIPQYELSDYNRDLDFSEFIFQKGREFEKGILRLFQQQYEVLTIAEHPYQIRDLSKAKETFETMRTGAPVIYQAVLWDAENLNYGAPDFLIRSDILQNLFPNNEIVQGSAPDLGFPNWHYVVVDTKFTTLGFNADATQLDNSPGQKTYKALLYIYNRMLGRLQGRQAIESYLIGRGWEHESKGVKYRCPNAMDRLGPVPQNGTLTRGGPIAEEVENSLKWIRRVRTEGRDWDVLPVPSVSQLYPNMNNQDETDHYTQPELESDIEEEVSYRKSISVKHWLANELNELTELYNVGVKNRQTAHDAGIFRWNDVGISAGDLGVRGSKVAPRLNQILAVNVNDGPKIRPSLISEQRKVWHATPNLEFYVDFEYCTDLNDDFRLLPRKGGQPLIFMIGCGHLENGDWEFRSFVVNTLSEAEELRVIRKWVQHMSTVRDRLDPDNPQPRVIHWSRAEINALENNHNSARARHGTNADWSQLKWFDFLTEVVEQEPVVVRGALKFGLKPVANAMSSHGLIQTHWADSQIDGLGAMVGAWRCAEQAQERSIPLIQLPLMQEIAEYNEIDCKVMMEIIRYLRTNH